MSLEQSINLIDFLSTELKNRSARNPRYSLRAFAQTLKLSAGELSEILRGKRKPSLKGALKIAKALGLSENETQHLIRLTDEFQANAAGFANAEPIQARQLTLDLFHVVSDWYCFAILNLADTARFSFEPKRIARRLGITEMESKIALERLQRVGLIERINRGGKQQLRATPDYVISPNGIPSEAVKNYHRQILDKARLALDEQSLHERDIAGVSFAIDPADIPKVKKEIHNLLDQMANDAAKRPAARKTEVYHLETAFFRLTKPEDKK